MDLFSLVAIGIVVGGGGATAIAWRAMRLVEYLDPPDPRDPKLELAEKLEMIATELDDEGLSSAAQKRWQMARELREKIRP